MRLPLRIARASFRTLAWSALFITGGVLALLRTALGHEVVLGWIVDQVDARVAGRVDVAGIRSGNILRGGRLLGVELRTPRGQVFLTADSVEVAYSVRGLLTGDLTFRQVRVWGVEMDLVWEPGEERSTLQRWIASSRSRGAGSESAEEGGGPTVVLQDLRIVDADFRLRRPTSLDQDGMVRVLPSGGGTLALDLAMDSLRVPELRAAPDADGGTRIRVASGSGRLDLLRETLPIREISTEILIAGGRLNARVDALRIPQSRATGEVTVFLREESPRRVQLAMALEELRGETLTPILDWVPAFTGSLRLEGVVDRSGSSWFIQGLDARWEGAGIRGDGTLRFRDGVTLQGLDLRVQDLPMEAVSRYVAMAEGKPGRLSGNVRLDGPVDRLGVVGRVGIRTPGNALSTADVNGVLVREGEELAFSGMEVFFSPLAYPALDPWIPGLPVAGSGSALVRLDGGVESGLRVGFDLTHRGSSGGTSRVRGEGGVREGPDGWRVDVQGDAAPFHLLALRDRRPDLPVQGAVTGSFRVVGPLDSLGLHLEVEGEDGRLLLDGTLDPRDLTRTVEVSGSAEGFRLGSFLEPAGDRTLLTGEVRARARGRGEAMVGEGMIRLADSNLRGLPVDSIFVATRVQDGTLVLDTARASLGGFEVDGGGTLALPEVNRPRGTMELRFRSDSLMGLRPAFLGEVVHARDTLRPLDEDILLLSGIDPDTLPLERDVTLKGTVDGRLSLTGAVDDFRGTAFVVMDTVSYGDDYLAGATLEVTGESLPGEAARLEVALDTDSLRLLDREMASSRVRAVVARDGVRASVRLIRSPQEEYLVAGGVAREGDLYRVDLDQADLRFDSLQYSLSAPARFSWSDSVLVVDRLDLVRDGPEEVRITASGVLPQRGDADFQARVQGVRLERITQLLQLTGREWQGRVDLDVRVQGPATDPLIQGEFQTAELVVGRFDADSTRVLLDYAGREAQVEVVAWRGASPFLEASGTVPADLSLQLGVDRTLDRPMDLQARIREVEVAPILEILEDLEDIQGVISGDFTIRGTIEEPIPEGLVRLDNGAWTVGALGVRQSNVNGTFALTPDRSVAVNVQATSGGRLDMSGAVLLEPLTNPGLDLELRFQGFQAVDRRDVTGALSGTLQLDGTYESPVVTGELSVDQGVLFLEEFQRAVGVVDLTDPLFLGLVDRGDFDIPVDRPLLAGVRNPFLDALRVNVDLTVPRDTWLRSNEMNVEIGGELDLAYDRPRRDLVLVGELLARRGQYTVLGRTFEVQGGTVSFIGIPGINPLLDIQAEAPIRRQEGGTLQIQATVQGSLVDPRVTLSTEEQGYAQSDLVSFLVFGRPSSEIAGSNTGQLESTAFSGVASIVGGTLATQLGTLAAQRLNFLDYLSVSQVGDLGAGGGGVASSVSSTQVEVGWYLGGGDIFGVLIWRPFSGAGTGTASTKALAGVRLEWQSSEQYHWEAFMEDRLLRRGTYGLTGLNADAGYSYGFAFFREWGY